MSVTAMFVCEGKTHDTQTPEQGNILLRAVTGGSEEAKRFFAFTPYGELRMGTLNSAAFEQFEPGKTYLLTIEEYAPEPVRR